MVTPGAPPHETPRDAPGVALTEEEQADMMRRAASDRAERLARGARAAGAGSVSGLGGGAVAEAQGPSPEWAVVDAAISRIFGDVQEGLRDCLEIQGSEERVSGRGLRCVAVDVCAFGCHATAFLLSLLLGFLSTHQVTPCILIRQFCPVAPHMPVSTAHTTRPSSRPPRSAPSTAWQPRSAIGASSDPATRKTRAPSTLAGSIPGTSPHAAWCPGWRGSWPRTSTAAPRSRELTDAPRTRRRDDRTGCG